MPSYTCAQCEQRQADVVLGLTATGDQAFLCLLCLPPYVGALWESSGLPTLVFDVADQEAGEAGGVDVDLSGDPGGVNVTAYDPPLPDDEPDSDGEDEATPEEPGVIELMERKEGRQAVKPSSYRRPKSSDRSDPSDEDVESHPSAAANDHR